MHGITKLCDELERAEILVCDTLERITDMHKQLRAHYANLDVDRRAEFMTTLSARRRECVATKKKRHYTYDTGLVQKVTGV